MEKNWEKSEGKIKIDVKLIYHFYNSLQILPRVLCKYI